MATRIRQPYLVTQQVAYQDLPRAHIPIAEQLIKKILSLPIHHNVSNAEMAYVVQCIREFYGRGGS